MGLENLIAYTVVFGVPLWLVTEELLHWVRPHVKAAAARVRLHRVPKRAHAHAHVAGC